MRPSADSKTSRHTNGALRQPAAAGRRPLPKPCPYLGIVDDPATAFAFATPANACFCKQPDVKKPYTTVELAHQEAYCLTTAHTTCPIFRQAEPGVPPAAATVDKVERASTSGAAGDAHLPQSTPATRRRPLLIGLFFVLLLIALLYFGRYSLPVPGATLNGQNDTVQPALSGFDDEDTLGAAVVAPDAATATVTPATPVTSGPASPKAGASREALPAVAISPTLPPATATATASASATSPATLSASATATNTAVATETATGTPTTTPAPTLEATPCGPPAGWVTYIVQAGENLYRISLRHNSSVALMMQANCLSSPYVYAGQRLFVPFHAPTSTPLPEPTSTDAPPPTDEPPPPPPVDTPPPPTETPAATPTAPAIQTPTPTLPPIPDPATATPAPTGTPPQETPIPPPSATP